MLCWHLLALCAGAVVPGMQLHHAQACTVPVLFLTCLQEMIGPIAELAPEYAVGTIILDLLGSQVCVLLA